MEQFGQDHKIFIADDGCNTDLAKLAASEIAANGAAIVTGFLCNEAAIAAAGVLADTDIPVLVAGAQSTRLLRDRERESWNIWRMAPGDDAPARATARFIAETWQNTAYALVDDGTIYGRNFTDSARLELLTTGSEPQFSDNFRAVQSTQAGLLRRLVRSGVTSAMIAASTRDDLITIARDRAQLGIPLQLLLSEAIAPLTYLEEASDIPAGLLATIRPYPIEPLPRLSQEEGAVQAGLTHPLTYQGYAAIQLALDAFGDSTSETVSRLKERRFETVLGPVRFSSEGRNLENPYRVMRWNGNSFEPLSKDTPGQ